LLRRLLIAAILLACAVLALHWRPGRQVRLHQQHLQEAVENRNWKKVAGFVAENYSDSWGQSKAIAMQRLPDAFQDFIACGVLAEGASLEWKNGACAFKARIHIVGSGGPLSQLVIQEMDNLRQPFEFQWRRQSWKPWDWALAGVSQPEIPVLKVEQLDQLNAPPIP